MSSNRTRGTLGARSTRSLTMAIVIVTLGVGAVANARQAHKWWRSEDIVAELEITDAQADAIEAIYDSTQPMLRSLLTTLRAEERALSDVIATVGVEEWELALQIDQVESARSALSKARTLMLFRMRQQLSDTQLLALRELEERRSRQEQEKDRTPDC